MGEDLRPWLVDGERQVRVSAGESLDMVTQAYAVEKEMLVFFYFPKLSGESPGFFFRIIPAVQVISTPFLRHRQSGTPVFGRGYGKRAGRGAAAGLFLDNPPCFRKPFGHDIYIVNGDHLSSPHKLYFSELLT